MQRLCLLRSSNSFVAEQVSTCELFFHGPCDLFDEMLVMGERAAGKIKLEISLG